MIKISIITVLYNAKDTIENCIKSVLSQTYSNIEYIIVDGASTDGSIDIIKNYAKSISYFVSEADSGIYDAYNKAINLMTGDWCFFLNSDDALYDSCVIEDIVKFIDKAQCDIIYGSIKYDNNRSFVSKYDSTIIWKNTLHHQSAFYKTSIFNNYRYNTTYKVLSDYKLNLELFFQGVKGKKIDRFISMCGSNGITKKINVSFYCEEAIIKASFFGIKLKFLPIILFPYLKYLLRKLRVYS